MGGRRAADDSLVCREPGALDRPGRLAFEGIPDGAGTVTPWEPTALTRRRLTTFAAFLLLTVAMAWPVQDPGGWTQNAHYALVRSLAAGTPHVDRYRAETGDLSYRSGHYYAAKAPGVAFLTLPVYAALHSTGLWPH